MTNRCIDAADATSCAARDEAFWGAFFADQELFRRMCGRWLRGNRHDAEDAISRGALRALDYYRRHPGKVEKFRPWMLRLLYNLCADIREAQDRLTEFPGAEDEEEQGLAFASAAALPDRAVYSHELREVLGDAVDSLPQWLHSVFCLRILDEVEYPDICRRFKISPENARQRIQQARRHLRTRLAAFT